MQCMLDICFSESVGLDLNFNVKKSMAMRIGNRYKNWCATFKLGDDYLQLSDEIKYLGVNLKSGSKFGISVTETKFKFYRCFNALYSKCKSASSELACVNLMKSFCLPVVLYT